MTGPRVAAALVGFLVTVAASAQRGRTPSSAEVVGSVIAIIDGDTIRARDRDGQDLGRIRLLGIDAPELAHGESPQQCWAARAKARLAQLAPVGATIRLRSDPTQADRDAYGRPLRYVLVDGRDIQEILLVEGQARPFWPEGPGTQAATYRQSAQQAERNGRGLWAACATEGASR